ncbi:hypothetical protein HYT00_01115 [Candidatus Giovannonibacteria bacterium]|nr:hypothetical protein [Candidatus Giovannonibacteria bacterium]
MINLLPYDEKKKMEQERLLRFLIVASLSLSSVLFLGIVLMSPSYFNLRQQKIDLEKEEEIMRKNAPAETMDQVNTEIKKNLGRVKLIEFSSGSGDIYEILEKILDSRSHGISLIKVSFDKGDAEVRGKIIIGGRANARDDLLLFTKNLEELGIFNKIDSPISNILRKKDIDFSLTLDLIK